jgi:hypothetical protein
MKCIYCSEEISPERLEALPKTETCVKCSKEEKCCSVVQGTASGKGSTLNIFSGNNKMVLSFLKQQAIRSIK